MESKVYSTRGVHLVADIWDVDEKLLDDEKFLIELMIESAKQAGATVLGYLSHKFEPKGVSVNVHLQESHCSIHTYIVECNGEISTSCYVDAYTCGDNTMPEKAINYIQEKLQGKLIHIKRLERGNREGITITKIK